MHLLAAVDHATRAVLAQRQVNGAPGEVPGFVLLLAGLDLAGVVVTADALGTGTAQVMACLRNLVIAPGPLPTGRGSVPSA